jgi:1,4-dihydroxy-2-naphthoate polyprenyltransferase
MSEIVPNPPLLRGSWRAWVLAARPATLTAAFVPVGVGTGAAMASGGARWLPALAALLGAFAIQIGTNFANDVFDAERGADTEERVGPTRAVQAGLLSGSAVRGGMMAAFGFATLCGVYLVVVAGWPVVAIGVASIASGIAYTGGPYPLGYHGLGDVFVMFFFGFVAVTGTCFVQTGDVSAVAVAASVPVGSLATAILVVNNLRDRATDAKAGKRTLAVRLGRRGAEIEYAACLVLAYLVPVGLSVRLGPWLLSPLASGPLAARLFARLRREEGASLNPVLVDTAKLLLVHGVLFALGLGLAP